MKVTSDDFDLRGAFPEGTRTQLREFFDDISRAKYDAVIFMARKALRLFDCFQAFGEAHCDSPLYSQHILDEDPTFFKDKNILLVDDTLILGSTLYRTKNQLEEAGCAKVDIYVFARDTDWSMPALVEPTEVYCDLNSDEMLEFCATEVETFSNLAIPYLSDFPMTVRGRFDGADLSILLSSLDWYASTIKKNRSPLGKSVIHTITPSNEVVSRLEERFGFNLARICEVAKIRVFRYSTRDGHHYCKFVPIVCFQAITEKDLERLFYNSINILGANTEIDVGRKFSPKTQIRFFQYLLSILVFSIFEEENVLAMRRQRLPSYDWKEVSRHMSPRLTELLIAVATKQISERQIRSVFENANATPPDILPRNMSSNISSSQLAAELCIPKEQKVRDFEASGFFLGLMKLFVRFFEKIEIPARQEILDYYKKHGHVDFDKLELADRLKTGVTWSFLINAVTGRAHTWQQRQVLSLYLDRLVDTGIAVPSICVEDGKVFRVYRHGETVLFGERELALSFELVQAFLETSGRGSIPRQDLQKLLALFVRLAAKKQHLSEILAPEKHETFVRFGYQLHGAVVYKQPYRDGNFAGQVEDWLTTWMESEGVVSLVDGSYVLGQKPEAAVANRAEAEEFAQKLGYLTGKLRPKSGALLNANDLAVLVSAGGTLDVLASTAAELRIFGGVIDVLLRRRLSGVNENEWRDPSWLNNTSEALFNNKAKTALNSALMKLNAYGHNRHGDISKKVGDFFSTDPMYRSFWKLIAPATAATVSVKSERELAKLHSEVSLMVSDLIVLYNLLEFAVNARLAEVHGNLEETKLPNISSNIDALWNNFARDFVEKTQYRSVYDRLREISSSEEPDIDARRALDLAVGELGRLRHAAKSMSEHVEEKTFLIGRMQRRTIYRTMVWYDIVESRGLHLARDSDEHELHVAAVKALKSKASRIAREAQRAKAGTKSKVQSRRVIGDGDDEKELFFGGEGHRAQAFDFVERLMYEAKLQGVGVRVLVVPGDVEDSMPYSVVDRSEINGNLFLETFGSLKKLVEAESKQSLEKKSKQTCSLWLVGSLHENEFRSRQISVRKVYSQKFLSVRENGLGDRRVPASAYVVSS